MTQLETLKATIEGFHKPYKDYPLTPYQKGWCKKVKGKLYRVCKPCHHEEALMIWREKRDQILGLVAPTQPVPVPMPVMMPAPAPVVSNASAPSISLGDLRDRFLAFKEQEYNTGEIVAISVGVTADAINRFVEKVGEDRVVSSLTPQDFGDYRHDLASAYNSVNTLERHIVQVRGMFKWAVGREVIAGYPRWNESFAKPSAVMKEKYLRKLEDQLGTRMFKPREVRNLIRATKAKPELRAMIYLGINCGLSNTELANLRLGHLDLANGWLSDRRHKTGVKRRSYLWPETVAAINRVLANRPVPVDSGMPTWCSLLNLGSHGSGWTAKSRRRRSWRR